MCVQFSFCSLFSILQFSSRALIYHLFRSIIILASDYQICLGKTQTSTRILGWTERNLRSEKMEIGYIYGELSICKNITLSLTNKEEEKGTGVNLRVSV